MGVAVAQIAHLIVKDCPCTDNVTLMIIDLHEYYSKTNFTASDVGMINNSEKSLYSGLSSPMSSNGFPEESSVSSSSERRSADKLVTKRVPRPFNCTQHFQYNFDNPAE